MIEIKSSNVRNTAFTLDVNGRPRLLFKVREATTDQGLTVIIRHALYGELPNSEGKLQSTMLAQQYLSVHPTDSSKKINVITMRTRVKETKQLIPAMTHHTAAMKQHTHYAPIFTHRCSDLSHDRFVYKKENNAEVLSLGKYEVQYFQPIYMILVSNKETPNINENESVNCLQVEFSRFRITLLWSFLSLASVRFGRSLLLGTLPEDQLEHNEFLKEKMALLRAGFPPETCLFHFASLKPLFKQDLIEKMLSTDPACPPDEAARCIKSSDLAGEFFKSGLHSYLPYQAHMHHVRAKLLEDPAFHNELLK